METVNINQATPEQLSTLLGLRPEEVGRLVAARPFNDLFTLRRALPYRVARSVRSFDIPKLDLNGISQDDLVGKLGIDSTVAQAIVKARPYYFISELRRVPGVTEQRFNLLSSVCALSEFSYVDKSTGLSINLDPDLSKVVVNFGETEDAAATEVTRSLGLSRAFSGRAQGRAQVYTVPDTEAAADMLSSLRQKPGVENALPGFREGDNQRFLDPEYCIVRFRPDVPLTRQNEIIAQSGLEMAERHRSPGLVTLHIAAARSNPGALMAALVFFNAQPEVEFAEPNFLGFDDMEWPAPAAVMDRTGSGWHLDLIHLPAAWGHGTGSPDVILAVIDSGVDVSHPALSHAVLPRRPTDDWDFVSDEAQGGDPFDDQGHGTFIAGILVGNGTNGVQGICPRCRLLPLRVPLMGQPNSYARRADAILYALNYVSSTQRLIINLSWKTTGDVAAVRQAIRTARERGAVVVASAGNEPERANQPHLPSDYPEVISVAAVQRNRRRASYSFYGDRINVAAPGGQGSGDNDFSKDVLSAAPSGGVAVAAGTSFAAPHVAGAAGLVLSQNQTLTPADVQSILQDTAMALQESGLGHGLIDVGAAVAAVRTRSSTSTSTTPTPPPPTATGSGASENLAVINLGAADELTRRFGLRSITVQLLVMRRPFANIENIRNTLGLTAEQYAAITRGSVSTGSRDNVRALAGVGS